MSEPAKDEAELMERVAEALYDNYDLDLPMSFTLAAIRAAGWAVVPVEPTDKMLESVLRADWASHTDLHWADAYRIMLAAAPEVKP
jgi:hypothetical protein